VKICVIGISGVPVGKHNIKDPRLDQADKLVEAKKKTYAQVDVVGEDGMQEADMILVSQDRLLDVIFKDLEFIEARMGREPGDAEKGVLEKLKGALESERTAYQAGLTPEEWQSVAAHNFHSNKPVVVAGAEELGDPEGLMVRAFRESGYICFLTVGGKENRAWPIRRGLTAWEAAGSIHTDIQKGFVRAEVIGYEDFIQAGGETQAKRAGKQRLETKTYVMQDCDLVNFRSGK
jgi:hypothetical protein